MLDKCPEFRKQKNFFPNKELIEKFKCKFPEYENIERKVFDNIMKKFSESLLDTLIENREGVAFPEMLGAIFIGHSRTKSKVKSYCKYVDNEANVYSNIQTDGRLMKVYYSAYTAKIPYRHYKCWSFKLNKVPRRKVSDAFKKNWKKYVDTTNIKINELFVDKEKQLGKRKRIEKKFNELDI